MSPLSGEEDQTLTKSIKRYVIEAWETIGNERPRMGKADLQGQNCVCIAKLVAMEMLLRS